MVQACVKGSRVVKILCLGNNTPDTDNKAKLLAKINKSVFFGLLNSSKESIEHGYYHSSIYDLDFGELVDLAKKSFDKVVVLNQNKDSYTHPDAFYSTIKAADLISQYIEVEFLNLKLQQQIKYWEHLIESNPSFCIFPFIELLVNDNSTTVCCRSSKPIVEYKKLGDFKTNQEYQQIRSKMLAGIPLPEHCHACYSLEHNGIQSARQQETVEWANRLNLNSIDDLDKIQTPVYYEVRASNVCNLKCRTCGPADSSLIYQEYKQLNLIPIDSKKLEYTNFDMVNFDNLHKLYVAGGEPTTMIEFDNFLVKCIKEKNTNFELLINTNGVRFSEKFKQQINCFSNASFIFSIDGFESLNYYIRFPSNWEKILENAKWAVENKHWLSFNVTVSIYNVANLYELLEFFDLEFAGKLVHCQLAVTKNETMSAYIHPCRDAVLDNLLKIKMLKCYNNSTLLKSFIDGLIKHYEFEFSLDTKKLQSFFEFNDVLDRSRNVKLADYLPNLDSFRHEIYK